VATPPTMKYQRTFLRRLRGARASPATGGRQTDLAGQTALPSKQYESKQKPGTVPAQGGFTLVEIAVVLLVVSLVLAMVVKAESLVLDGRTKQFMRDIETNRFAYLTYTDRYAAVPGDDAHAAQRWPGARKGNGDSRVNGTYLDSVVSPLQLQVDANGGETINYWWHLRLAGLITSGDAITDLPKNVFGGTSGVQQTGFGMRGPVLCYENVPGEVAAAVDRESDDGRADDGALRGSLAAYVLPAQRYEPSEGMYVVCASLTGSLAGAVAPLLAPAADNASPSNPSASDPNDQGGNRNAHGGNPNAGGGNPNAQGGNPNAQGGNPNAQGAGPNAEAGNPNG